MLMTTKAKLTTLNHRDAKASQKRL